MPPGPRPPRSSLHGLCPRPNASRSPSSTDITLDEKLRPDLDSEDSDWIGALSDSRPGHHARPGLYWVRAGTASAQHSTGHPATGTGTRTHRHRHHRHSGGSSRRGHLSLIGDTGRAQPRHRRASHPRGHRSLPGRRNRYRADHPPRPAHRLHATNRCVHQLRCARGDSGGGCAGHPGGRPAQRTTHQVHQR